MTITANDTIDRFIANRTKDIYAQARAKGIEVNDLDFSGCDTGESICLTVNENERLLKLL